MDDLISRWSHYFLRYCAGTVVGAIIVVFLANHLLNDDNPLTKYVIAQNTDGKIELAFVAPKKLSIYEAAGYNLISSQ
jgi:hypothetical protein